MLTGSSVSTTLQKFETSEIIYLPTILSQGLSNTVSQTEPSVDDYCRMSGFGSFLDNTAQNKSPCCPVLYLLIKTHKLAATDDLASIAPSSFRVPPIVNCVGGPTNRIAWFLNAILVQLLKYIPSHLTNTQMFLNKLQALQPSSACVMESFDVESLHTNVSNVSAMEAVLELLNQYQGMINMHGFSTDQVMSLLKECLTREG